MSERSEGQHNRILIVTGVSGCGKDWLITKGYEHDIIPENIRTANIGSELFPYLQKHRPDLQLRSRDDLRTLSKEDTTQGLYGVIDTLIEEQPLIITAHTVRWQEKDKQYVSNPEVDERLRPLSYLYVSAEPEQIFEWRRFDKTRSRITQTVEEIKEHQELAIRTTQEISQAVGASMTVVKNKIGNTAENLEKLEREVAAILRV